MMATKGFSGDFEGLAEVGDLLFHQQAGDGGLEEVGDAFRGGVGAMGGAEGVVDVDVGQRGQGLGEGWIVGFFFGVVAEVFKQQHLAGLKLAGHFVATSPMQSGAKATLTLFAELPCRAARGGGRQPGGASTLDSVSLWGGRGARPG